MLEGTAMTAFPVSDAQAADAASGGAEYEAHPMLKTIAALIGSARDGYDGAWAAAFSLRRRTVAKLIARERIRSNCAHLKNYKLLAHISDAHRAADRMTCITRHLLVTAAGMKSAIQLRLRIVSYDDTHMWFEARYEHRVFIAFTSGGSHQAKEGRAALIDLFSALAQYLKIEIEQVDGGRDELARVMAELGAYHSKA